jgi:hypothetical protein
MKMSANQQFPIGKKGMESVMKSRIIQMASSVTGLAVLVGWLGASTAMATTWAPVIQDSFSSPDGSIQGRTPDVTDLPESTWGTQFPASISGGTLQVGGGQGGAISIASANGYIKPSLLKISADLNLGPSAAASAGNSSYNDTYSVFGVDLGFFATPASYNDFNSPTPRLILGIDYTVSMANPSLGELLLVGSSGGSPVVIDDLGLTGFGTNGTYNLSYVVNTVDGSISDLLFGGNSIAVPNTALFTDAATMYAGVYQRPNGYAGNAAFVSNFTVSEEAAIPEPSIALFWLAGGILIAWWRRATRPAE